MSDLAEIEKFNSKAEQWWDLNGEFKTLHQINPVRLQFMQKYCSIDKKKILDVGCGGGIYSELLASNGANVTGIDLAEQSIKTAQLHLFESKFKIDYQCIDIAEIAKLHPEHYDIVCAMETLEHVADPALILIQMASTIKPQGHLFISTINKTLKAYLLAVITAEYCLNLIPRGTHHYAKFIKPSQLKKMAHSCNLELISLSGIDYQPYSKKKCQLSADAAVNYIMAFKKNAHS